MEGHCSTGQSPQWAVVTVEEEEEQEQEQEEEECTSISKNHQTAVLPNERSNVTFYI